MDFPTFKTNNDMQQFVTLIPREYIEPSAKMNENTIFLFSLLLNPQFATSNEVSRNWKYSSFFIMIIYRLDVIKYRKLFGLYHCIHGMGKQNIR